MSKENGLERPLWSELAKSRNTEALERPLRSELAGKRRDVKLGDDVAPLIVKRVEIPQKKK